MDYSRGNFESLFRDNQFDVVIHLGRMGHTKPSPMTSLEQRISLNLMGTNRILELSLKFNVKKVIVLSTFHVYGAYADNPVFISEGHPLRASIKYPDLRDVVEMDQLTSNWIWKNQNKVDGILLRPCNIIGPRINNVISNYLKSSKVPIPMDFNPIMQFISEYDMAKIINTSIEDIPSGIYNVTTPDIISLSKAKKRAAGHVFSMPLSLVSPVAHLFSGKIYSIPGYLFDYLKYSCVIDSSELMRHLPKDFFRFNITDSLDLLKSY